MASSTPTQDEIEALLNGPALTPPLGVKPNFESPPNHNGIGYGLISAMLAIAAIAIACRIYTRIIHPRRIRVEDGLGIASFILFVAYLGCAYKVLQFPGFYVHQWNVRVRDMQRILYHIATNCYNGTVGALKAAILLEWLQLFNPSRHRNSFFWTCHITLWIHILFYSASVFAINLVCIPRRQIWDKTITDGHCNDGHALYLAGTIVNLISDIAILATPQQVIWSLQMSFQKKVRVSCVFAIGILCVGLACARIATTVESPWLPDSVYNLPTLVFLGVAEMVCALLVFCAPVFPETVSNLRALPVFSQISFLLRRSTTTKDTSLASPGRRSWVQRGCNLRRQPAPRGTGEENLLKRLDRTTPEDEEAIIRTTEFDMRESYTTRDSESRGSTSQGPWHQSRG
ncbi:hypothetical protein PG993_011134 [Apiospora rasikravindrae]|uniref:Rhodopsin domain-containing protein n=1 Tax=Apiospora rasikravindrae TaxID=990691 RepID=A0ABR1SDC8_9PEZI